MKAKEVSFENAYARGNRSARRCLGLSRNLNRCNRRGEWRGFCREHRKQPLIWMFFLIFTVGAGTASILSYIGTGPRIATSSNKDHSPTPTPLPEKNPSVSNERREELAAASIAANSPSFSPVTMQDFFRTMFDSSFTSIQHDEFLERQLGRTVVWRGYVSNVASPVDKSIEVSLVDGVPGGLHLAFLKFSVNDRAQLISLNSHQEITIAGVLEDFDGQAHLKDCRIVKVFPTKSESNE